MSALPFGTFIRPGRALFESGAEPLTVGSITGVSTINGTIYPPVQVLPTTFDALEITNITGVSTINGAAYPPAAPAASPKTLFGTIALSTNGQTFTYSTPFTSSVSVVVQGTANAAGVNGFFTVATYGSLSTFRVFYSGALDYGAIQLFFIAVGT